MTLDVGAAPGAVADDADLGQPQPRRQLSGQGAALDGDVERRPCGLVGRVDRTHVQVCGGHVAQGERFELPEHPLRPMQGQGRFEADERLGIAPLQQADFPARSSAR